uniref:Uncharacterized protein n=1 Tax=Timema tahoe TaxID=61484 RepID=A0A7R9IU93_9NEOP|nr:unnamed protein product [Timema tahoe]
MLCVHSMSYDQAWNTPQWTSQGRFMHPHSLSQLRSTGRHTQARAAPRSWLSMLLPRLLYAHSYSSRTLLRPSRQ